MGRATLSLCMILRDEAELLPRFIDAVDGLWDEWIAVDTGSTDDTVKLLEAAGATVVHEPWRGDFAAARNVSLGHATGDWVLVLDADEFLHPDGIREIRALIEQPDVGAATVPMRNRLPHGHERIAPLLRLFRNAPGIWFEFPIHEDVTASVRRALDASGWRMAALTVPVEHVGYALDRAVAKDKKARDLAILERCIDDDPDDVYSWFKLLSLARFWSDKALTRDTARAIETKLREHGDAWLGGVHVAGELIAMLSSTLHAARPGVAAAFLDEWVHVDPRSADLRYRRGEARENAGDPEGAAADYLACLEPTARTQNLQMTGVRPRMGLARLALGRGRIDDAFEHTEAALSANPRDPEALLCAAVLWHPRHPGSSWDAFLAWFDDAFGAVPELYETVAERCLEAGQTAAAARYLSDPHIEPLRPRVRLLRARLLLVEGRIAACRAACMDLLELEPRAGLGVLVCDLIEGRASSLTLDLDEAAAHAAMRVWVDTLRACQRPHLVQAFRQYAGAVMPVFPWLAAAMAA